MFNFYRLVSVLMLLVCSFNVLANTPTPEQIEQFKKLPKAQQEMLAAQYGMDLQQLTTLSSQNSERTSSVDNKATIEPRIVATREADGTEKEVDSSDDLEEFGYDLFAGEPTSRS